MLASVANTVSARNPATAPRGDLSDPVRSITNPNPFNPDNPNMTAGMTFLGQFLDHDNTFDKKSTLNANASPCESSISAPPPSTSIRSTAMARRVC
jgi:hypothetical protein